MSFTRLDLAKMNDTITIGMPDGSTIERPRAFSTMAAFQEWRGRHARKVVTVEQLRQQAATAAGKDCGLSTAGELRTASPEVQRQYRNLCDAYFAKLNDDVRERNATAMQFNARLSVSAADVDCIRFHTENHGTIQRQAVADARPLSEPPQTGISMRDVQRPPERTAEEEAERSRKFRRMSSRDLATIRAENEHERLSAAIRGRT